MYFAEVTIPNPDNPHDPPIYEGFVGDAHKTLTPGVYRGAWVDDITGMVDPITGDQPVHDVIVRVKADDAEYACVPGCEEFAGECPDHPDAPACVCPPEVHARFQEVSA